MRLVAAVSFLATIACGVKLHRPICSKLVRRVVLEVGIERGGGGLRAHVADRDRVAVGRGLGDAGHARGAAGAADVLDHQLLAQRARHVLADDAGDDVGRPARGERHDHGDGLVGVGRLGHGTLCQSGHKHAQHCNEHFAAHHVFPLLVLVGLRDLPVTPDRTLALVCHRRHDVRGETCRLPSLPLADRGASLPQLSCG